MSEYIPFEIQVQILKKLPIIPLIQFRSVCKTWKSLIDSPAFIASHVAPHPQPDCFILRYTQHSILVFDINHDDVYLTFADDHTFTRHDFAPTIPQLNNKVDFSLKVVDSCHGLFCCYGEVNGQTDAHFSSGRSAEMVILWNPLIRKSIGIQVPSEYAHNSVFGFGVCPVTIDPTILKISFHMPEDNIATQVEIFTLSSGTWEILSTNLPRESFTLRGDHQVIIGRFIYWIACDLIAAEDGEVLIYLISFDLTAKVFKEIILPDVLALDKQNFLISKLRESLVVLEYPNEVDGEERAYSLWMMTMDQSFTRLYNIKLPDSVVNRLLGFRKTGEPILETQEYNVDETSTLEVYEPYLHKIDNLGIVGDVGSFFMCSYMETLLLHDQSDGYIYYNSN